MLAYTSLFTMTRIVSAQPLQRQILQNTFRVPGTTKARPHLASGSAPVPNAPPLPSAPPSLLPKPKPAPLPPLALSVPNGEAVLEAAKDANVDGALLATTSGAGASPLAANCTSPKSSSRQINNVQ